VSVRVGRIAPRGPCTANNIRRITTVESGRRASTRRGLGVALAGAIPRRHQTQGRSQTPRAGNLSSMRSVVIRRNAGYKRPLRKIFCEQNSPDLSPVLTGALLDVRHGNDNGYFGWLFSGAPGACKTRLSSFRFLVKGRRPPSTWLKSIALAESRDDADGRRSEPKVSDLS
jgi:hypothetical protein